MKCPRCQQNNPSHAEFCLKCGAPVDGRAPSAKSYVDDLEDQIDELKGEIEGLRHSLSESLEQQTATAEILRVISASPADLTPVLNTVVQSAARFCGSEDASLFRLDGDTLRQDANHGPVGDIAGFRIPVVRGSVGGRTVLERRAVHVADLQAEVDEFPEGSAIARRAGHRTILSVPLLREGTPIGVLQLRRAEVNPFTDKQIALLKTFADQAVIAIENVRLFNETKEALDRQTATAEILRVISESPTNVQPVFDVIAVRATTLCDAELCIVQRLDGEQLHLAAIYGADPAGVEVARKSFPMPVSTESGAARAVRTRGVVHLADVLEDPTYALKEQARVMRFRSGLAVPMLREGHVIGVIVVMRTRPGYFAAIHVELLKTFADQAVIAIENVRLFNETKEALDQQTATSDILRVISQSPTDVQPVFDAIASSAVRLCESTYGVVHRFDGTNIELPIAMCNVTDEQMALYRRIFPLPASMDTSLGESALTRRTVQVEDTQAEHRYTAATEAVRVARDVFGYRTVLMVPMVHRDQALGIIAIWR